MSQQHDRNDDSIATIRLEQRANQRKIVVAQEVIRLSAARLFKETTA